MGIKLSSLRCWHRHGLSGAAALPSDVVFFEILSRTPVKSLCRFRCVSKEWRAVISDPVFTAAHYNNNRRRRNVDDRAAAGGQPLLAVQSYNCSSLRLIHMDGRFVKVIDNLGGLPMKSICNGNPDHVVCAISIWIVATVVDLVTGEVLLQTGRLKGSIWGFGRAAAPSGAYKLLSLGHGICEVLTVGGGEEEDGGAVVVGESSWRPRPPPPANYALSWCKQTAAVNGTLHVLAEEVVEGKRAVGAIAVLCFDLALEVWKKKVIKGPPDLQAGPHRGCNTDICELNGALCMVRSKTLVCTTDVWLLTDDDAGGSGGTVWSKAYSVRRDPYVHRQVMPLRVKEDGGELLFYYALGNGTTSVPKVYDPRDGTRTDAMKMPRDYTEGIALCSLPLDCFVS